jgi:putative ABC transport system permease protein
MTQRASGTVGVDWQVEVQPGADPNAVLATIRTQSGVSATRAIGFARITGLRASSGATTQTTGPGVLLGLPLDYGSAFPGTVRLLAGSLHGALVAQQTAANLHVVPGDTVIVGRQGLRPAFVTVAGVVDFSQADSLFQSIGAPAGAQPQSTPDNVLALPMSQWQSLTEPLVAAGSNQVTTQIHVRLDHRLGPDPAVAFSQVTRRANNLEARLAGAGRVADNLAVALGGARADAFYAQVLFLTLALPGVTLAGLLAAAIADVSSPARRREQALLRSRGATRTILVRLALAEAALVAVLGGLGGVVIAMVLGRLVFHETLAGASTGVTVAWLGLSALVASLIATIALVIPALRGARQTVNAARLTARPQRPLWLRYGLDLSFLAAGALVFWLSSRNGYQLILAPEGVPSISVSYWPLAAPALIWVGGALLGWRIAEVVLRRARPVVAALVRPVSAGLAETIAASMQRQRQLLARGVVLVALSFSFAASSSVFNETYARQARVDALLTNGADVTVTEPASAAVHPMFASTLRRVPGVVRVEPLQHRYAYVGADLQDLFGVDPRTIVNATSLQDAYFQGGTAAQLMAKLARRPDNILVSAETVRDYQLQPNDELRLRIRSARSDRLRTVTFHYAGIAKEFPTAPRDSFLIANKDYVAAQTGSDAVGAFLITTSSPSSAVAARVRSLVGAGASVTDLATTRAIVGTSLTAVDLSGLTRVELGYAILLVAAMAGLLLWLGFVERRRRRLRDMPIAPRCGLLGSDRDAHGADSRVRPGAWPRCRGRRLRREAVQLRGAECTGSGTVASGCSGSPCRARGRRPPPRPGTASGVAGRL